MNSSHRSMTWQKLSVVMAGFAAFCASSGNLARAQLRINEVGLASDRLEDPDGDATDWIELYNASSTPVSLAGWSLTDDPTLQRRWTIHGGSLAPATYLLVYASGKDRQSQDGGLHTHFKLDKDGEFLAVVHPDGTTTASPFPALEAGTSYGVAEAAGLTRRLLIDETSQLKYLVPTDDSLGLSWIQPAFDGSSWTTASFGLGYSTDHDAPRFVRSDLRESMYKKGTSVYVRCPFSVEDPASLQALQLFLRYDDGFVAWINGVKVAERSAPSELSFRSSARGSRRDSATGQFVEIKMSRSVDVIQKGRNMLVIHGLNKAADSTDFLLDARLESIGKTGPSKSAPTPLYRHFVYPTPGAANGVGPRDLGPALSAIGTSPSTALATGQTLTVTAQVQPVFAPIASVKLCFRFNFGPETCKPMTSIPASTPLAKIDFSGDLSIPAEKAGALLRYYVLASDTLHNNSRWPMFPNSEQSPEYLGGLITESEKSSSLPIFHWFIESAAGAQAEIGTRASLIFEGQLYDNIFVRSRGGSVQSLPKKSYKFDFLDQHLFRFQPDMKRVDEVNLNATYTDKSGIRPILAFDFYRQVGIPAPLVRPVRVHQNGTFMGVYLMTEQVDKRFLERNQLDPKGALYKFVAHNALDSSTDSVQKKSRRNEGRDDLQELVSGLQLPKPERLHYLFDHLNIPALINYVAATNLINDRDLGRKNYYVYRDTRNTGEWRLIPWDKDLTLGKGWTSTNGVLDDMLDHTGVNAGSENLLLASVYSIEPLKQMYFCRLRTLMDAYLKPQSSSEAPAYFEQRITDLQKMLQHDILEDYQRWANPWKYGKNLTFEQALDELRQAYLEPRRRYLYDELGKPKTGLIPPPSTAKRRIDVTLLPPDTQPGPFLLLKNHDASAQDLSGWRVSGDFTFTLHPGTVLPSKGELVIASDISAARRLLKPTEHPYLYIVGPLSGQVPEPQGRVELFDTSGKRVAQYQKK